MKYKFASRVLPGVSSANSHVVEQPLHDADAMPGPADNPLLGLPHHPMSKRRYQRLLQDIFERFPWLGRAGFEPAPGHLTLTWAFLLDVEKLKSSEGKLSGTLLMPLHATLAGTIPGNSCHWELLDDDCKELIEAFRKQLGRFCMVCGAPLTWAGPRCQRHASKPAAFFAGHFRGVDQDKSQAEENEAVSPLDKLQPHIRLLDLRAVGRFHDSLADKGRGGERAKILERVEATGEYRRLQVLPPDWKALLDKMESEFPNFSAFADMLRDQFALAACGNGVLRLPNTLFVGEPGIGKTEMMRWLSAQLAVPFVSLDMASAQSNSQLSGSEAFWSNTKPGKVFNQLIDGPVGNPLFLLDELDKVGGDGRYDPLSALYSLLERSSAERFIDLSIEKFSVDASHINWLATANSVRDLPKPLLSRFCVLEIPSPDLAQSVNIARNIYGGMLRGQSWGGQFHPELSEPVLARLSLMSPRIMKTTLERALGCAARSGRRELIESDIPPAHVERKRPFGFLSAAEGQGS